MKITCPFYRKRTEPHRVVEVVVTKAAPWGQAQGCDLVIYRDDHMTFACTEYDFHDNYMTATELPGVFDDEN